MHGSDLEVAIRKWQWSCMIVCEWPLQFSFHYFLFPFSPHFSQAHHPPLAQMRLFTLHPGSLYENHNFLDKVNYITANVNETGYGGVSQRTAVSWSQESFQLNFSPKKSQTKVACATTPISSPNSCLFRTNLTPIKPNFLNLD